MLVIDHLPLFNDDVLLDIKVTLIPIKARIRCYVGLASYTA